MKIKILICITFFYCLISNIKSQIDIKEITWNNEVKQVYIDSVLSVPSNYLFPELIKHLGDLPQIEFYYSGLYIKKYLLNNNIIVDTWVRNQQLGKPMSIISDRVLDYALLYLKLKTNTIYLVSVYIYVYQTHGFRTDITPKYFITINDSIISNPCIYIQDTIER
ncbi:MAG TPA: hypothetical protein PLF32_07905 [Bacteroidales bacterium]|nr:hypothetical protein [Bacteroidales bacterium]HOR82564.1 hypothetical protein [Bacteroidales bacterium]HPJ90990.1 hypothetical protein [Bacteroidales bacterium]